MSRASHALRAPRPAEPPAAPEPAAAAPADPVDAAIEVLRATPFAEIQARGWHFQKRDFYSPLNDLEFLEANRDLWHDRPMPAGVDWDLEGQLESLRRLAGYVDELADVPQEMPAGAPAFHWLNNFWSGIDALVHYGLIRETKPRRVVEIGCGWSSLLLSRALAENEREGAPQAIVDQIEPYPRTEVLRALPDHWDLHETILQRAPLSLFEQLEEGDVCFYDGSHVAKPGSDVVWFFAEVLPRLKPGVLIHVHDIFWPIEYPEEWIVERGQTWNEQYVLQGFLMYNREFTPLLNAVALRAEYTDEVEKLMEKVPAPVGGGSFWMRRVAP
ncbi:MAG TPA: class I SAM-dependent methyltransferase [Solirubrobacterales bacterium]|nr:class I SAM-dependent methyltransferase [Solirubrobacterales bacterium]